MLSLYYSLKAYKHLKDGKNNLLTAETEQSNEHGNAGFLLVPMWPCAGHTYY